MKTDKELLELAAKAEGRILKYMSVIDGKGNRIGEEFIACWNPLVDDGDAFRLDVKLMNFEPYASHGFLPCISKNADATRRAIVRAAAAIGESM